jgi:steroid delta-isomerase-like uncharacterized protein
MSTATAAIQTAQQTIESYLEALLSFGDYGQYFADDVSLTFMGTDTRVEGREGVQQFIDLAHQHAFDTDIRLRNAAYGDGTAILEAEFIGTHIGEFQGVPASGRQVDVPYAAAYELEGEKIKALRLYFPLELLMQQITS